MVVCELLTFLEVPSIPFMLFDIGRLDADDKSQFGMAPS